jgi:hypothetical protein
VRKNKRNQFALDNFATTIGSRSRSPKQETALIAVLLRTGAASPLEVAA